MKEIIYNKDNLKVDEITKSVKRAKIIIENFKNELMIVQTTNSYYLVGGHVENNESDVDCLYREIKEEMGIDFYPVIDTPFMVIRYLCKDYPNQENTEFISNYYFIKADLEVDVSNLSLTNAEKANAMKIVNVKKDDIVNILEQFLETCDKNIVVRDTLDVIKEYLKY